MFRFIALLTLMAIIQLNTASANDDIDKKQQDIILKIDELNQKYAIESDKLNKYSELAAAALEQQNNKNYKKAIELCNSAIKLAPEKSSAYYIRGEVHNSLGKSKLAKKDFNSGLRAINDEITANPSSINYFYRGRIYYKLGDFDKADDDVTKACKDNFEYACMLSLRIKLDRIREHDWKLMADYDISAIYFKTIQQKSNIKYVWMRQEFYDKDSRNQILSSFKGLVNNIDGVMLLTTGMKLDCSNSSVLTEKYLFYSSDYDLMRTLETNNNTYQTIAPDTSIDYLYNQVCKNTK